jgi:hypothetical protein
MALVRENGELQGSVEDFASLSVGQFRIALAVIRQEAREHRVHGVNHAEVEHLAEQLDVLVGLLESHQVNSIQVREY